MATCAVPSETANQLFVHYNVLFMHHDKISVPIFGKDIQVYISIFLMVGYVLASSKGAASLLEV